MKKLFMIALFIAVASVARAGAGWYLSFSPGINFVPPVPLVVKQSGYMPVSFWARYETSPLKSPVYYSVRLGFNGEKTGWEAEMNHLKIYLKNNPAEIQRFSISHGYNQVFVTRSKLSGKFALKTGLGIVVAHPENTVRNQVLDEKHGKFYGGYHLAGFVLKYGIERKFYITGRFFLMTEACLTAAYANVPVANGRAQTPVLSIHFQFGPGYFLIKKQGTN